MGNLPFVSGGVVDNTAAFQAALDAAKNAGGGTVRIPEGTYLTGTLELGTKTRLQGAGRNTTLKAKSGTTGSLLKIATNATAVVIDHMTLDVNDVNLVDGINFDNTGVAQDSLHRISNVWIYNAGRDGIHLGPAVIETNISNCFIFRSARYGVMTEVGATDNRFTNVTVGSTREDGFLIKGNNTMYTNCKAFYSGYNYSTGVFTDGYNGFTLRPSTGEDLHAITMSNCEAQNNARNGYYFDGSASAAIITYMSASNLISDGNNMADSTGTGFASYRVLYSQFAGLMHRQQGSTGDPGNCGYGLAMFGDHNGTSFNNCYLKGSAGSVYLDTSVTGPYTITNSPPYDKPIIEAVGYGLNVGATDNSTALQAALNAVPSTGGTIVIGAGEYNFTSGVTIPSGKEVTIVGDAGWTSTVPKVCLKFNGTGSGSFINAQNSIGVTFRDVGINYTSTSFTGRLLDLRNVSGSDSAYWIVDHCSIGGLSVATSTAVGIAVNKAIDGTIRNCHLYACSYAIDGMASGNYANGITVEGSVFRTSETAHIHNVSEAWTIIGNIFEGLRGGGAAAIKNDASVLVQGGIITGNWCGDVTTGSGSQFDAQFMGTQISGNYIGGTSGSTGINLQDGSIGFAVTGNRFAGMSTGINLGVNCNNYTVSPNSYTGVTTLLAGTTSAGLARNYTAAMTAPIDVYRNNSSSDGRCAIRYQADRTSTKQYDLGVDPDGGAAKMFALRDVTAGRFSWKAPSAGGFVIGDAVLSTSATDGFLYVPTCAGTPTGVPNTQTGTSAVVYDTTANKLWVYNGGWKSATFT
jgi:hypothetical protein